MTALTKCATQPPKPFLVHDLTVDDSTGTVSVASSADGVSLISASKGPQGQTILLVIIDHHFQH